MVDHLCAVPTISNTSSAPVSAYWIVRVLKFTSVSANVPFGSSLLKLSPLTVMLSPTMKSKLGVSSKTTDTTLLERDADWMT